HESFTKANCHVSPNSYLHRAPETDSQRAADPTSRMDRAKWRILHAPHGTAGRIDAKGIQRVYRCCSSRLGTGIKLNRHRSCWINQTRAARGQQSPRSVGVGAVFQRLSPTGERSGLLTRIAATESGSLCVRMTC